MNNSPSFLNRAASLLYGAACYVLFLGTFLYLIGFVTGLVVPKTLDSGTAGNTGMALVTNALLLSLFAVQHNLMARPEFKRWWTRIIPKAIERSTFVLFSSLILVALYWLWAPLPQLIWEIRNETARLLVHGIGFLGWGIALLSTFLINHFDLFGLKQVYEHLTQKASARHPFRTTGLYKYVRHPLMLGFLIAFWATPTMTLGHLLFSGFLTIWIVASLQLEERDLETVHGEVYRRYKQRVPMLLPLKGASGRGIEEIPENYRAMASTHE